MVRTKEPEILFFYNCSSSLALDVMKVIRPASFIKCKKAVGSCKGSSLKKRTVECLFRISLLRFLFLARFFAITL